VCARLCACVYAAASFACEYVCLCLGENRGAKFRDYACSNTKDVLRVSIAPTLILCILNISIICMHIYTYKYIYMYVYNELIEYINIYI